jgi:hypothetical protein
VFDLKDAFTGDYNIFQAAFEVQSLTAGVTVTMEVNKALTESAIEANTVLISFVDVTPAPVPAPTRYSHPAPTANDGVVGTASPTLVIVLSIVGIFGIGIAVLSCRALGKKQHHVDDGASGGLESFGYLDGNEGDNSSRISAESPNGIFAPWGSVPIEAPAPSLALIELAELPSSSASLDAGLATSRLQDRRRTSLDRLPPSNKAALEGAQSNASTLQAEELAEFMVGANLSEFTQRLVAYGVDSIEDLNESTLISDAELVKEIGMKRGHVKKLRKLLQLLDGPEGKKKTEGESNYNKAGNSCNL